MHRSTCFQPAPPPPHSVLYFHLLHLLYRFVTLLHTFQSVAFSISYVQRLMWANERKAPSVKSKDGTSTLYFALILPYLV